MPTFLLIASPRADLLLMLFLEGLDLLVEIGFKQAILNDAVLFKLTFCVGFGNFGADLACIL